MIQNGACSEKLPSVKRNELARLCAIDATANSTSTRCGARRGRRAAPLRGLQHQHKQRQQEDRGLLGKQRQRKQHHAGQFLQPRALCFIGGASSSTTSDAMPKKNISSSLIAENHITAS